MKLLCDHMLGSLAKWLRIFGIDTLHPADETSDDQLLELAHQQQRVILTRDKALLARAKKHNLKTIAITTTNLEEQLHQALAALPIDTAHLLSRCILCNTPLTRIEKDSVRPHVPAKVFETRDEFWYCPVCQKYYWMGTHYENMMHRIQHYQNTH
ncbi:MAG: Mut7-C RNAse domain-containing protein [Candidatus Thermoplasmatota archaeon]|nr:Mut7-C RNAse domain-containing protein [Candidatus Thermoplasmatota archaeon]